MSGTDRHCGSLTRREAQLAHCPRRTPQLRVTRPHATAVPGVEGLPASESLFPCSQGQEASTPVTPRPVKLCSCAVQETLLPGPMFAGRMEGGGSGGYRQLRGWFLALFTFPPSVPLPETRSSPPSATENPGSVEGVKCPLRPEPSGACLKLQVEHLRAVAKTVSEEKQV